MEEGTVLKLISVIEIIFASLAGAYLPFMYLQFFKSENLDSYSGGNQEKSLDSQPIFFLLKALSCGIIIGVALCHLLPDANEMLSEHWEYPVCFATAGLGIVLCLVCEQFAMWIVSTSEENNTNTMDEIERFGDVKRPFLDAEPLIEKLVRDCDSNTAGGGTGDGQGGIDISRSHQQDNMRNRRLSSTGSVNVGRTISVSGRPVRFESNCELGMAVRLFANANDTKTLLKAYVLEGAIAIHSIIMGISLGAMDNDEVSAIRVLMIAYGIHQSLEGISLGCAISATDLSTGKMTGLIAFFCCTLPFGILVGLSIASATESESGEIIAGFANGIAAGILIYVSMVEMMADEFSNKVVVNDFVLKAKMILSLIIGMGIMALLAVWA